ncbi:MAG: prephenate dehydrogenase/arogenate dehydrogenase family protein [Planctomycetales bacterium]|nr:prephenate dehydrogenase/arogenate dehydrogenase family protein [Planctomycetales bacterium]
MASLGTVAIVGPGLIGGSIGLALQHRRLASRVIGVSRRQATSDRAMQSRVVTQATIDLAQGVAEADLVVVCTPVGQVSDLVLRAARACPQHCLITDAGSTKAGIIERIEESLPTGTGSARFVGSHPLAGGHCAGPEAARADLLEGQTVVVTPTENTPEEALTQAQQFWTSLGAVVTTMSPAEHDAAVAHTSHLPHVLASALAASTPEGLLGLCAGGWRDTTRVAGGSAGLWCDILLDNRECVLSALHSFDDALARLRAAIAAADRDAICRELEEGKLRRDALGS